MPLLVHVGDDGVLGDIIYTTGVGADGPDHLRPGTIGHDAALGKLARAIPTWALRDAVNERGYIVVRPTILDKG